MPAVIVIDAKEYCADEEIADDVLRHDAVAVLELVGPFERVGHGQDGAAVRSQHILAGDVVGITVVERLWHGTLLG